MRSTSTVLKWAGFGIPIVLSLLGVYALLFPGDDVPGSAWGTVVTAVVWLTPMVVLTVLAARWPAVAAVVLAAAVTLFVGVGVWYVLDPAAWDAWEGPDAVRGAIAMVLLAPVAVLGLRHTGLAAVLLWVIGVALAGSMVLAGVSWEQLMNRPEASVSAVAAIAGTLYVISEAIGRAVSGPSVRRSGRPRSHAT